MRNRYASTPESQRRNDAATLVKNVNAAMGLVGQILRRDGSKWWTGGDAAFLEAVRTKGKLPLRIELDAHDWQSIWFRLTEARDLIDRILVLAFVGAGMGDEDLGSDRAPEGSTP